MKVVNKFFKLYSGDFWNKKDAPGSPETSFKKPQI